MSTLTKQWLQQKIADMEAIRDDIPFGLGEDGTNTLAAMRIALASLEARSRKLFTCGACGAEGLDEPLESKCNCCIDGAHWVESRVYTAPPAPESVPDGVLKSLLPDAEKSEFWFEHDGKILFEGVKFNNAVFDACRAAMLQGADGTLTNEGTIPVTQFKPVADMYGLTSPTGSETSFTFDAVEARDFIDGGWSCQEYVELGRFQEAMLQNGNSPAQSDCCPEQNYIAPAQDGNSPVIPDGWVMVPVEPTEGMIVNGFESEPDESFSDEKEWEAYDAMSGCQQAAHRAKLCWSAMIAAAPKPEVK
ncbi:hypothetical protein [Enterobacter cloacae complex sp. 306E4]|uniref:hypothetical protein n=1 Tax=Enterobacter cloacae complex sp. 306E4 TaxID=3395847 RepID=UPI003CF3A45F